MARVRLTTKTRIANDPADMEGNRQDCGKKTRFKKYENFDPAKDDVGGRGKKETDGSQLYQGDKELRNEMHVTELKLRQAKMWERSKLATKLAMYLLGEKAPQSMIKAQAAEFLSLGNAKLAKAVSRFAKTEYLYADEQEQTVEEVQEKTEAPAQEAVQEKSEAPAQASQEKAEEPVVAEQKAEEKAEAPAQACVATEQKIEAPAQACGDVSACDCGQGESCPECAGEAEQVVEQAAQGETDEISDETLASLFETNGNTIVANKTEAKATAKVGVQKFEQPQGRVASNKFRLEDMWAGAPDLSSIFN